MNQVTLQRFYRHRVHGALCAQVSAPTLAAAHRRLVLFGIKQRFEDGFQGWISPVKRDLTSTQVQQFVLKADGLMSKPQQEN